MTEEFLTIYTSIEGVYGDHLSLIGADGWQLAFTQSYDHTGYAGSYSGEKVTSCMLMFLFKRVVKADNPPIKDWYGDLKPERAL